MNTSEKMDKTWTYCLELYGPRCVALTLHGSQNYCLDLPISDVDAKLMVVPSWDDIIHCAKPASETIKGPYGDINVTDIRLFIGNNLRKQNFNFIECLFTPYYRVNPQYVDLWGELIAYREDIAHYKPEEAVRTMMGQMENQKKRWGKFDDTKTLYHMLRIKWAIIKYVAGADFIETMIPTGEMHDFIMGGCAWAKLLNQIWSILHKLPMIRQPMSQSVLIKCRRTNNLQIVLWNIFKQKLLKGHYNNENCIYDTRIAF